MSQLDHVADPRVRKERAAARAVNSEIPAAYEVLHQQPREATIRSLTASKKPLVKGVLEFWHPTGNLKGTELANLCVQTIDGTIDAAHAGIARIRSQTQLAFAFMGQTGLSL